MPVAAPSSSSARVAAVAPLVSLRSRARRRDQSWQEEARRACRDLGPARFAAGLIADTVARVRLVGQRREGDLWVDDVAVQRIVDRFGSARETQAQLMRRMAWHLVVTGECALVAVDGERGVEWQVASMQAVTVRRDGTTEVRYAPGGAPVIVASDQVMRVWAPDEEWPELATSPMRAALPALRRWELLERQALRLAESRLVSNGMLWLPSEAMRDYPTDPTIGDPAQTLVRDFTRVAEEAWRGDDPVAAVAPFIAWWSKEWGPPQFVKVGDDADDRGHRARREALEDFARALNLPSSIVIAGGPGDSNHWTEWLADEKAFAYGVAPVVERICGELTAVLLRDGLRVWFDASAVVVPADRSRLALQAWTAGLISAQEAREACGFETAGDGMVRELQSFRSPRDLREPPALAATSNRQTVARAIDREVNDALRRIWDAQTPEEVEAILDSLRGEVRARLDQMIGDDDSTGERAEIAAGWIAGVVMAIAAQKASSIMVRTREGVEQIVPAGSVPRGADIVRALDGELDPRDVRGVGGRAIEVTEGVAVLTDDGQVRPISAGVWRHGYWGFPARAFDPHVALDGVEIMSMDDDRLFHGDAWPGGGWYYPGDHVGCTCAIEPLL